MARLEPDIPPIASAPIRELTIRAFILGAILALILGAANAYLGLYAGMTVSASIPAAVISMALLRMLGGATILENNVVQTIASAGEAVAAGAIFTFPALVILGNRAPLPYLSVTMLCLAGGTMGSLLVVFLRRTYIVEERLAFPEGRACAEVLRSGAAGSSGVKPLAVGGAAAAILKFSQDILGLLPGTFEAARRVAGVSFTVSLNLSAALVGVGYIIGIETAMLVFVGGAIGWFVAIPIVSASHPELNRLSADIVAHRIWSDQTRYLGVGAMMIGGAATLWRLRRPITRGLADSIRVAQAREVAAVRPREDSDLPPSIVLTAVACCAPAIFAIIYFLGAGFWIAATLALALLVIGFFATAVAGYLSGIVGASNNPVSGVTIMVLLAIALVLKFLGIGSDIGPRLAILAGAVVCTAAAMAGDSMHDLATGFHLRASPWALETAVLTGAALSAIVMAPILNTLISAYGIAGMPGATPHSLSAPQAFLMAKVGEGVFRGNLPWGTVTAGAALACLLLLTDRLLARRPGSWRTPVMPVAIGLYLPLGLGITILAGAVLRRWAEPNQTQAGSGLMMAAGMVAGEALTGVLCGAIVTAGVRLPLF